MEVRILPAGDRAMVVEFGDRVDDEINARVHALAAALAARGVDGITETVPTFRSLLVLYDPGRLPVEGLKQVLSDALKDESVQEETERIVVEIPVCYRARFAPDMKDMERITGLSEQEIVAAHSGREYKIHMMGFLPGFPYLGGLDPRLNAPRLSSPRLRIPAGSVGIGGTQTGIYPVDSPGGWRLIGATPLNLYQPGEQQPILLAAGEYVRFRPIGVDEYYDIRQALARGRYEVKISRSAG